MATIIVVGLMWKYGLLDKLYNFLNSFDPKLRKSTITLAQTLGSLGAIRLKWTPQLKDTLAAVSASNINIEVTAPDCAYPVTFESKWLAGQVAPVITIFFFGFFYSLYLIFNGQSNKRQKLLALTLSILDFFYFSVVEKTLIIFDCKIAGEVHVMEREVSSGAVI
jgi:hypothetical protein